MLEISDYILDELKDDATLITLLGADSNDSRIYSWNPPFNIIFSPIRKAAIFYRYNQNPRPTEYSYPSQKGNIYFYFSVESPDKTLTKQIGEEIVSLFESKPFSTNNWKIGNVIMNGSSEGVIGGTGSIPIHKQNVSLLLKDIFKRGLNPY
jgi:hypothetical protein